MFTETSLIVGMGPGGLETAIALFDLGHQVILVDKREDPFMRDRRIVLDSEHLEYLLYNVSGFNSQGNFDADIMLKYTDSDDVLDFYIEGLNEKTAEQFPVDHAFFQDVLENQGVMPLRNVQKYLFSRLQESVEYTKKVLIDMEYSKDPLYKLNGIYKLPGNRAFLSKLVKRLQSDALIDNDDELNSKIEIPHTYPWINKTAYPLYEKLCNLFSTTNTSVSSTDISKSEVIISTFCDELLQYSQNSLKVYRCSEVCDIDLVSGNAVLRYIDLRPSHFISFDNLICAEGASRSIIKNVEGISIVETEMPIPRPAQKSYGIVRVQLNKSSTFVPDKKRTVIAPLFEHTSLLSHTHLKSLERSGWKESYLPIVYIQFLPESKQFYLAGETPHKLLELGNHDEIVDNLTQFGKAVLLSEYPDLKEPDFDPVSVSDDASVFHIKPTSIDIRLESKAYKARIFSVGDALQHANFLFGMGLRCASMDAYSVRQCFSSDGRFKNYFAYHQNCKLRISEYHEMNKGYRLFQFFHHHPRLSFMFKSACQVTESIKDQLNNSKTAITWLYHNKPRFTLAALAFSACSGICYYLRSNENTRMGGSE